MGRITRRSFGVHAGGAPKYCKHSLSYFLGSEYLPGTYVAEGFEELPFVLLEV